MYIQTTNQTYTAEDLTTNSDLKRKEWRYNVDLSP